MIKINFIADEVMREKYARIRKYIIVAYSLSWIISFIFLYLQIQENQAIIISHNDEIKRLNVKMEKISPPFEQTVYLYGQRKKHQKKLAQILNGAVEKIFVIESLEYLAQTIPKKFWVQDFRISALGSKTSADNKKGKGSPKISMVIHGNLLLDLDSKKKGEVQQFQTALQKHRPFSLAESQLDLINVRMSKLQEKYYQNFVIKFNWLDYIL